MTKEIKEGPIAFGTSRPSGVDLSIKSIGPRQPVATPGPRQPMPSAPVSPPAPPPKGK